MFVWVLEPHLQDVFSFSPLEVLKEGLSVLIALFFERLFHGVVVGCQLPLEESHHPGKLIRRQIALFSQRLYGCQISLTSHRLRILVVPYGDLPGHL